MRETFCHSCRKVHALPAYDEFTAPERETARDFLLALATWGLVVVAYIAGFYAIWAMTR